MSARRLLAMLAVLTTVVSLAPPASAAQVGAFGQIVPAVSGDLDKEVATGAGPSSWVFIDDDGDGLLGPDDAVFVSAGTGEIVAGDVRIVSTVGASGSRVSGELGDGTTDLVGSVAFSDADGDNRFEPGDTLYFDLDDAGSGDVSLRDVILSGGGAGDLVTPGWDELDGGLAASSGVLGFYDKDEDGVFDSTDHLVWDSDADGLMTVQDVRLGGTFGTVLKSGDTDLTYRLETGGPTSFVMVDNDGDDVLDSDEGVYLTTGSGSITSNSVRIGNPQFGEAGSQVKVTHDDQGDDATPLAGSLAFTGSSPFGTGDTLYYDLDGPGSGEVSTRDVILSGGSAGELATSGTGTSLTSYGGTLAWFDANGNSVFDFGDIPYGDTNGNGLIDGGDVQLALANQPDDAPSTGGGEQDPVTPPTTPPTTPPPTPPTTTTKDCPDGSTVPSDQTCPAYDEQAREDAQEAQDAANEARASAEAAQRTAQQAKQAAEDAQESADGARQAAEQTGESVDRLAQLLQEDGDGSGLPGPGPALVVIAGIAAAWAVTRRRR